MEIRTERLILRPWRTGDEPALAEIANNRKIWINLRDLFPHPYTLRDAQTWVAQTAGEDPTRNFAVETESRLAGGIGLDLKSGNSRLTAQVGYWLGESFWGRGLAAEALRAVTDYAFARFDLRRLEAGVFEWNPASTRVLEKCGFSLEGRLLKAATKDGKTIDVLLYTFVK
jgi:[ribosomal protein S5]-alanine N-acetyltransferase